MVKATKRPHRISDQTGQAMIELAVFGSMMIVVLGAMVHYAMNADLEQQTTMRAVREAMWSGARAKLDMVPSSENYMHINDSILADPTNPLSIGGTFSAAGNWSTPTRSFRLGEIPETQRELPRTIMKINGQPINCPSADLPSATVSPGFRIQGCTTAGFRLAQNVWGFKRTKDNDGSTIYVNDKDTIQPIDKYDLIYGIGAGKVLGASCTSTNGTNCRATLRLIDPNEGELVSRDQAVYFCRQILDFQTCFDQCLLTKNDPADPDNRDNCTQICSQPMAAPQYCDANNPPTFLQAQFAALFPSNLDQDIGFQAGSSGRVHELDTTMRKVESPASVQNTSQVNRWVEGSLGKAFFFRRKSGGMLGIGIGDRDQVPVPDVINRNVTNAPPVIWDTPND